MNGLQNKIREEKKSFTYTLPYIQGNVAELAKVEGNCAAFINHFISSECVESGWKDWNINELKELDICATYFSFIYDDLVYDIKCQLYSHLPHDVIIRLINTPTKKSYNDYKLSIKPIMEKFEKSSFILKEIKKDIAKINGDNDKNANE
ncbi:MAG TPA: hypothetical protein VGW78_01215 [Candidatus Babeliales bacterium]|nr:hypothetical protein [Candidatus Babeliales bacterium]